MGNPLHYHTLRIHITIQIYTAMTKSIILGANTVTDTEVKTVGIGQIIRMEGYEYDNYVVADITHNSYGYSYCLINVRTYEYVTAETIRPLSQKFGIGFITTTLPRSFSVRMNCVPSYTRPRR